MNEETNLTENQNIPQRKWYYETWFIGILFTFSLLTSAFKILIKILTKW